MDNSISVFVSKSEPDDAVARLQSYGLHASYAEMGTDYCWFPHSLRYGIERKTVSNLLGSLKDRQLVEQAQRGVKAFDRFILLIEGRYDYAPDGIFTYHAPGHPGADREGWVKSGWQWRAIDGMLNELSLTLNIPIVRCPMFGSAEAVARVVMNTANDSHAFLRERQRPSLPATAILGGELYSDALWALMALPGCGPEIAEGLIAEYGTLDRTILSIALNGVHEGFSAPQDVKVNGRKIGVKRIEKMRAAVVADYRPRPLHSS